MILFLLSIIHLRETLAAGDGHSEEYVKTTHTGDTIVHYQTNY